VDYIVFTYFCMFRPLKNRLALDSGAFVLVSVLLLIAVLTVLVVMGTMVAQIERTAASNAAKVELARAHALFGLEVALDQLQTAAGPDQRITARAENLDSDPTTGSVDGVLQPFWTGVWRTGAKRLDGGVDPQRVESLGAVNPTAASKVDRATWLVSNPRAGGADPNPLTFTGNLIGSTRDAVVMATNHGSAASVATVAVPLVEIQGPRGSETATTGAYAYWVADEGVKASVALEDFGLNSGSSNNSEGQLRFFGPPSYGVHKGLATLGGTDVRSDPLLERVGSLAALSRLDGAGGVDFAGARQALADFTLRSRGVLADVRRGGLKKDLTAALESTGAYAEMTAAFGLGEQMLYRSASSAGVTVPTVDTGISPPMDGLQWLSLFGHYNSYKATMAAPTPTHGAPRDPTSSNGLSTLPMVSSPRVYSIGQGGVAPKLGGLMPVPVAYRVDIALSSYEEAGVWRLRLHYYPQLVLWNPYSVRLSTTDFQFQRRIGAFAVGVYSPTNPGVTCIRITANESGAVTTIPYFRVNQAAAAYRLELRTAVGQAAVMEPGETRVFALDADREFPTPATAISFTNLVSNENTSADFSQFCDVQTGASTQGLSTGPAFTTADPNTIISVELAARFLRCQYVETFILPNRLKWPWNGGTVRSMAGGNWNLPAPPSSWPTGLTISQLNGAPLRIIGFYVRQKGLNPSASTSTYSNASTTVPVFAGNSPTLNPIEDMSSFAWQEVYLSPFGTLYTNGQTDVQAALSGNTLETSFGLESVGVAPPGTRVVLRDVPTQPMVSLGQFMHMPAANFWDIGGFQSLAFGSMFVGGGYASPILLTEANAGTSTTGTVSGDPPNNFLYLDDSFLANEALFDRFFFSTVPPATLPSHAPPRWQAFNQANSGTNVSDTSLPLLNQRLHIHQRPGMPTPMDALRNWQRAAGHLMLDGAFNVNSTSVNAWKAFLGGLSNSDLRLWNASTGAMDTTDHAGGVLVSRFWSAAGRTGEDQLWSGVRRLDDAQLDELARRIVEQVKLRGPFLSMADFLNRRLGANSPLTRSGALQAAIDSTTPDINAAVKAAGRTVNAAVPPEPGRVPSLLTENMRDSNGNVWTTALGAPGYLMQQDLVQSYAPLMTVRSDTFLIRVYGETRNAVNGRVEGRARGEALVQRFPDFVDRFDPAVTGLDGAAAALSSLNTNNQTFGREFRIVSFRWLNDDEI